MRGAGAARRREEQEPPPPDGASVEEGLRRVIAGSEAVQRRLGRHERVVAAELARMQRLAAECPNAERLAAAADKLATRYSLVAVELISDAAHNAEAREACELYVQTAAFTEAMRAAAFEAGRQAGIAEEQARQARPRAAGSHRKKHLRPVPGIPSAAARAAAVAVVTAGLGGGIAAMQQESYGHAAASPARHVALREMAPDQATVIPGAPLPPRAYVPRHAKPSADAASASPDPSSSPLPVFTPAPQPPPPSASPAQSSAVPGGFLDVQTVRVTIGPGEVGQVSFSVVGGALGWTAVSSSPSVTVSKDPLQAGGQEVSGVLGDRQSVVLYVSVAAGSGSGSGWVTVTAGGQSVDVPVTWVAVPGPAV